MTRRNPNFCRLGINYLFPEIQQRKRQFLTKHPHVNLISLGIGDTTEAIAPSIKEGLVQAAEKLGTTKGYTGYGPEKGMERLRQQIATHFYQGRVQAEDIFISDGAKCDIGRLQLLFGNEVSIAVQDPAYPVYVDGSILHGVKTIVTMSCVPENDFFPDLSTLPRTDLIYFCSPNNPTGMAATKKQLETLVAFAKARKSIIIFDSAYAFFIQDSALPRSIFEIEGAAEVALETSSFSKIAGFTGIRLGWTVVPEVLKYEDGGSVRADWNRLTTTVFNGASNIAQHGGIAVLEAKGLSEIQEHMSFYMENARLVREALINVGLEVYGGVNTPYLWVRYKGKKSWEVFQQLMETAHIVTTPGAGFGKCGEEFIRFSAFGHRQDILEAVKRIGKL